MGECERNRERNHEYDYFDKVIEYEYDYFVFLTNVIEYEYDSSKMVYDYTRVRFLSTITPSLVNANRSPFANG